MLPELTTSLRLTCRLPSPPPRGRVEEEEDAMDASRLSLKEWELHVME